MLEILQTINGYLADYILSFLLLGTGIYFTLKTRFVQIRCFGEGMKRVFGNFSMSGGKQNGGISSFQALTTAIAAQVGTGNIVGACGAILTGGPGAIFWMWIIALLGMSTIYAEAVLAQETRVVDSDGNAAGGPVYYIRKAFPGTFGKYFAGFFSVAIILALGFMGCMVQSNSISESCSNAFGVPGWSIGIVIAILSALIFLGGVDRIASVTEKLVPIMAVMYILGCLAILIGRIQYVPEAIGMIFKYAFSPQSIIGGSAGAALKIAISQGAKRGLFSNEAGMGSTPHAHAIAKVDKPHDQGVVAMIGVFIDTFVVLSMTALVVISCLYAGNGPLYQGMTDGIEKTNMAQLSFSMVFGKGIGSAFIAICLLFFAFSTVLSWNLFGKLNVQYLSGNSKPVVLGYTAVSIVFIFLGTLLSNNLVWELTDFFNYLMVFPNVVSLIALGSLVAKSAADGEAAWKEKKSHKA